MINHGNTNIKEMHLGSTKIWDAFLGDDLVYSKSPTILTLDDGNGGTNEVIVRNKTLPKTLTDNYKSSLIGVVIGKRVTGIAGNPYNSSSYSGSAAFRDCKNITGRLIIPDSVTSIQGYVFRGCSGIDSVYIDKSVKSIKRSAFYGCNGLKKVIIPDLASWCTTLFAADNNETWFNANGYTLQSSDVENPLQYAHHLYLGDNEITNLVIPNVVVDVQGASFKGCTGLTSVTFPSNVHRIGNKAFTGCTGLTSATFSNNLTYIGVEAFRSCTGLTSLTIPNSVTTLAKYAFYDCRGVTSINFESGGTGMSIGEYSFSNCQNLQSVYISDSVTSIGYEAFDGNIGHITVFCDSPTPPTLLNNRIFSANGVTIYVPNDLVETYKSAWSTYASKIEANPNS